LFNNKYYCIFILFLFSFSLLFFFLSYSFPLGNQLIVAVSTLLATPGFTVPTLHYDAFTSKIAQIQATSNRKMRIALAREHGIEEQQEEREIAEEDQEYMEDDNEPFDPDAPIPDAMNAVWPMLMWKRGIGFPELELTSSPQYNAYRLDLLRLLLVMSSSQLFVTPNEPIPQRCRFLDEITGGTCPFAPTLFYSLLNIIVSHEPGTSWTTMLPGMLASEGGIKDEPLVTAALHLLLILLDYAPNDDDDVMEEKNILSVKETLPAKKQIVEKNGETSVKTPLNTMPEEVQEDEEESMEEEENVDETKNDAHEEEGEEEETEAVKELQNKLSTSNLNETKETTKEESVPVQDSSKARPKESSGLARFNIFRSLLSGISNPDDFDIIFSGLVRLLTGLGGVEPLAAGATHGGLLSAAPRGINAQAEVLTLLWKFLEENEGFYAHVLNECDVTRVAGPIINAMWNGRASLTTVGVMHLCTFLLLLLSGERAFGVALNLPLSNQIATDFPILPDATCSYADALVVTLHRIITDANQALVPLFPCFITVIANITPYTKNLGVLSSAKLLHLLQIYSGPRVLFTNRGAFDAVEQLLECFNNIFQYQYESNAVLVYSTLRRRDIFDRLMAEDYTPSFWIAEKSKTRVKRIMRGNTVVLSPRNDDDDDDEDEESDSNAALETTSNEWTATDEWWMEERTNLPLSVVVRLIAYLEPLAERFVDKLEGATEDTAVVDFIRATTVVGILPVPHAIMARKYQPNAYTASWFTTFIWSTIFLSLMRELPLFDAEAIRMFAISSDE
jgi:Dyggve-Melchior-Clausen syndrome protein